MTFLRAALAALIGVVAPLGAIAQDITLTSHDGKVEVVGTLLGYDGEFYRLDTQFGELTIDGSGVTCDGPACPNLIDFVAEVHFAGSSVMAETLLPALIHGFAKQEGLIANKDASEGAEAVYSLSRPDRSAPLARLRLKGTDTGSGFADMVDGATDIVMAQREIRPPEQEAAQAAGLGDLAHPRRSRVLALDAIVPVVSPDNPVRQISPSDLVRVFSGDVLNWTDLGGPDAPIALHLPKAGSGLDQAIEDQLLQPARITLAGQVVRHPRGQDMMQAVSRDPFAIGIGSHAGLGSAQALPLAGGCGHALTATRQSVKTEDYPLTAPMFLYLPQHRLPRIARQFLAYSQTPDAQMVIREAGLVDQAPETTRIGLQGDRLANAISSGAAEVGMEELQRMIETLRPMSRLSLSFRFQAGSSRPDAQSRANILHLAQALEAGSFGAKTLTFVGFSDGEGPASSNARIARLRAKTVRNAVLAAVETAIPDSVELAVDGFGEAMPMACDDSEWGKKVNRRVEVWIK
ncbi:cell envelope biogenesis protein OmpA [Ruegeria sp. ANG-S4]|uniref:phosphate ABC transporter substrate-binding/OmpA family protein n=1 Tax=Ruegeria sp. ANG-S4 TaxID=1577904 RepID=UPI00057F1846|nr:phosphate ABC transporter substrate-binding/OmpA family protein [Ruegeria sp. ANG-S4]KIC40877.1 cell envelope biogenesis protein OmpA [Ruegeria sp. ANG-S4]